MKKIQYLIVTVLFVVFFMAVETLHAATFMVTNTNDSGPGSFRQAAIDANANNQPDIINFDPTVFSTPQTITLTSGQITLESDSPPNGANPVKVNGPGANLLTIDGNNQSRVIFIDIFSDITIDGIKVTGGNGVGGVNYSGSGGGILAAGRVTLTNSIVSGNKTLLNGAGGGIYMGAGSTIINSVISHNTSPFYGGGIYVAANNTKTIINSTISYNTTGGLGGGIHNRGFLHLTNCTIAFNQAINTQSGGFGGGVYSTVGGTTGYYFLYLKNTIIAKNKTGGTFGVDVESSIISEGFNILGIVDGGYFEGNTTGNQLNVDPKLDLNLSSNGGIIPSHALRVDSPAIDKGDNCVLTATANGGCLDTPVTVDARNVSRPQDGDGDGTATVDIGAFEVKRVEVTSAPSSAPDLQAASDSGVSDTDNITSSNNRSFNVGGVTAGAVVELLRNGVVIGGTTAAGNSVILSDNTAADDGIHVYTSRHIINGVTSLQSASVSLTIDTAAPTVNINQAVGQADPTNAQPINFSVVFNEQVSGFEAADVSLGESTAGVSTANITVSGSGLNYTVTVNNISADGSIIARILPDAVKDIAGNSSASSTGADNSVTLDTISPTVIINQSAAQTEPTRSLPVNFTVVFSESVTGFTNADISLAGSTANVSTAFITVTGSGNTYNVSVSNVTSNGGFVMASVKPQAASDAAGNQSAASVSTDNTVTIDNTSPTVTINQAAGQSDPTNALPINFTVVFSESVTGFDAADINFSGSSLSTTGAVINVSGSGAVYNVAVTNITSNGGFLRVNVRSSAATDGLGNFSFSSTSTDNQVTIDNVAPTVSINQSIGQSDPAAVLPISFTVVFNELVTGFDASDVSFDGSTADISSAVVTVTGSGNVYTINVGNIKSSGQVRASIPAGVAQDLKGNPNRDSISTDNIITVKVKLVFFDFDGDGKSDFSIYRPAVGEWWYLRSSDGGNAAFQFGTSTDKIVPADYTGDGKADFAFYRPSSGEWFILRSEDYSYYAFPFGVAEDIPVPADYDGDGKVDAAVFRPSTSVWYILRSTGGVTIEKYGASGDVPVPADYNGDGKTDLAVYNNSTGSWKVKYDFGGLEMSVFRANTNKPVPADYTGDGKADIALYDTVTNDWFIVRSENQIPYTVKFGTSGDIPAPADYDGDGKTDLAIYRPSTTDWWYAASSANNQQRAQKFGISTDIPLPSAYIP